MTQGSGPPGPRSEPDADLIEYLLVTVPSLDRLDGLVATVVELVESGAIRLIDVVVLQRHGHAPSVVTREAVEIEELRALAEFAEDRVLLSQHDVELTSVLLEPDGTALVLLVEDRWATLLSTTARRAGGRVASGERVVRDRFLSALDADPVAGGRADRDDLLSRGPQIPDPVAGAMVVDQAAQLEALARLVERGVLSLDQYEVQRRRVLDG